MNQSGRRDDSRAAWAKGYAIGAQVIGMALEVVVPPLIGFYIDQRFGLLPLFTLVGTVLGLIFGTLRFVQFCQRDLKPESREPKSQHTNPDGKPEKKNFLQ